MIAGTEIMVDALECGCSCIDTIASVRAVCDRIIRELELTVVGQPQWHQFPGPSGVTGLYLLSESHLTCHTFPEHALATFNLYCCRLRPEWPWEDRLREMIGARRVEIQRVVRGGIHAAANNAPFGWREMKYSSAKPPAMDRARGTVRLP